MKRYQLTFTLLSDTTFGRGDGKPGYVDREVEHDQYGMPYLRGRTLKGLLSEEVDNLLFALTRIHNISAPDRSWPWAAARQNLFGVSHGLRHASAKLHFGHAILPEAVRQTLIASINSPEKEISSDMVLESLTAVRRQTAIETVGAGYGVPVAGSLRAMRVILRQTEFQSTLLAKEPLSDMDEALLAAGVMALRRAGTGRNRGRGHLLADLLIDGESIIEDRYGSFIQLAELEA